MRIAVWFAGIALVCVCARTAMAVDNSLLRESAPGSYDAYRTRPLSQPRQQAKNPGSAGIVPINQGKTREEVKRELAAARASGCMDVPDSQYPQPCPSPETTRVMSDAFQYR